MKLLRVHSTDKGHESQPRREGGQWTVEGSARILTAEEKEALSDWIKSRDISKETREKVDKIMEHSKLGGPLAHLRPDSGVLIFRGSNDPILLHSKAQTYSKDEILARTFGERTFAGLTAHDITALSVEKALGAGATGDEVLVSLTPPQAAKWSAAGKLWNEEPPAAPARKTSKGRKKAKAAKDT